MKIAVSGAVSTGKTTLCHALAEKLQLPLIEEQLEPLFHVTKEQQANPKLRAPKFMQVMRHKASLEDQHERGFIVDRSPLDVLNFWLGLNIHRAADSSEVLNYARQRLALYDAIVLLPTGVITMEDKQSQSSVRTQKPMTQLLGSVNIFGLAYNLSPDNVLNMPRDVVAIPERVIFVEDSLRSNPLL